MKTPTSLRALVLFPACLYLLTGVAQANDDSTIIRIDGSSTVYPITEAEAEEYGKEDAKVQVTVGISGTGGGFKKFCAGETDISDASRPIKPTELELCKQNGIEFIELPIAYDALSIVVNKDAAWVDSITTAELKKIWEPAAQEKILRWNQIRPEWPNETFRLFGPGTDSGTFDYFTEAIMGKEDASRGDYTSSEDDNVLVLGVAGNKYAMGYFGLSYYLENKNRLKALKVDDLKAENGDGPIAPTAESVASGNYQPLSRPLFIYVSKKANQRPEITKFIKFYLDSVSKLAKEVGYISLPDKAYKLVNAHYKAGKLGSLFKGGSQPGVTIEDLLKIEQ